MATFERPDDEYVDEDELDDGPFIHDFPDEVKIPDYREFTEFVLKLKHRSDSHLKGSDLFTGDDYARQQQAEIIFVLVCNAMYRQWDETEKKWEYSPEVLLARKVKANAPKPREKRCSDMEALKMYRDSNNNAAKAARRLGYDEKYFARRIRELKDKEEKK